MSKRATILAIDLNFFRILTVLAVYFGPNATALADYRNPSSPQDCQIHYLKTEPFTSAYHKSRAAQQRCEDNNRNVQRWTTSSCGHGQGPKVCAKHYRRTCNILDQVQKARDSCHEAWDQFEQKRKIEEERKKLAEEQARRDNAIFQGGAAEQFLNQSEGYQQFREQAFQGVELRNEMSDLARRTGLVRGPPSGATQLSNRLTDMGIRYLAAANAQAFSNFDSSLGSYLSGSGYSAENPRPSSLSRAYALDNFMRVMGLDTSPSQPMPLGEHSAVQGSFSALLNQVVAAKNAGILDQPLAQALLATSALEAIVSFANKDNAVPRISPPAEVEPVARFEVLKKSPRPSAQPEYSVDKSSPDFAEQGALLRNAARGSNENAVVQSRNGTSNSSSLSKQANQLAFDTLRRVFDADAFSERSGSENSSRREECYICETDGCNWGELVCQ